MTFRGTVTDPNGEPLTGANVYVSDANGNVLNPPKGATADAKGNYKFDSMTNDYITASFVGMKKQTFRANSSNLDFVLKPLASEGATLSEVEIVTPKYVPKKFPTGLVIIGCGLLLLGIGIAVHEAKKSHLI